MSDTERELERMMGVIQRYSPGDDVTLIYIGHGEHIGQWLAMVPFVLGRGITAILALDDLYDKVSRDD